MFRWKKNSQRLWNPSLVGVHASSHVSAQNCRKAFRSWVFATFCVLTKALNIRKIRLRVVCIYIYQSLVPSTEGLFSFLFDVLAYLLGRISSSRIVSSGSRRFSCSASQLSTLVETLCEIFNRFVSFRFVSSHFASRYECASFPLIEPCINILIDHSLFKSETSRKQLVYIAIKGKRVRRGFRVYELARV